MQKRTQPRLIPLSEAFERIGTSYIPGWTGEERTVASLGQRSKTNIDLWRRARAAITHIEEFARDGRLGILAQSENGKRFWYFEQADEELNSILFPPDLDAPGFIQFASGTTLTCEADISRLSLSTKPKKKAGRKPGFVRFERLIEDAIGEYGISASNADLKNFARSNIGNDLYPSAKSTQNEIIDRVRERTKSVRPEIVIPAF